MSHSTLSRLETGQIQEVKSDALRKLSLACQVLSDFLLGGTSITRIPLVYEADANVRRLVKVLGVMKASERAEVLEDALRRTKGQQVVAESIDPAFWATLSPQEKLDLLDSGHSVEGEDEK